jgi:hypothetical protein
MENKDSIIATRKSGYYPSDKETYCIGSKEKASAFVEDGATRIAWDQAPGNDEYKKIRALRLLPNKTQAGKGKFPSFVKELENLSFLEIPLPFLSVITKEDLPAGLETLMISNTDEFVEWVTKKLSDWPDIQLPALKALIFFTGFGAAELPHLLNISQDHFPSLEYLQCKMDKQGNILKDIEKFTTLKHLEVEFASNHDVMASVRGPLEVLSIIGTDKNFPLNNLSLLKQLQSVWLNGIKTVIDCNVFTTLPDLLEVNVLNSKKIEHAEALLSCKKLKRIFFLNTAQPFKKIKDQFDPSTYERLDIKFS